MNFFVLFFVPVFYNYNTGAGFTVLYFFVIFLFCFTIPFEITNITLIKTNFVPLSIEGGFSQGNVDVFLPDFIAKI